MVVAVFLSNVPEALSAAARMKNAGHPPLMFWDKVVVICAASALLGHLFLTRVSENLAVILAFATGVF